jgi:CrcB protein
MLAQTLLVALGGALGSSARFLLSAGLLRLLGSAFPWGTLAVNVLGCFAAGWAAGRVDPHSAWRAFLIPGVLGGFTTFSAFGLETRAMGMSGLATAYVAFSLGLGLGAVWLGGALSR